MQIFNDTAKIPDSESAFRASNDEANFATDSDDTVAWALCTIDIVLNEHTYPILGDIFDKVYDTTYGVKMMPVDGTMINGAEVEF